MLLVITLSVTISTLSYPDLITFPVTKSSNPKSANSTTSNNSAAIFIVCVLILLVVIALLFLFVYLLFRQSMLKKVYKAIDEVYDTKCGTVKDCPIMVSKKEISGDIIENCTLLNLDYHSMENPIDIVMPKEKSRYKTIPRDKLFMWGAIVMGALVTLFTYIWGLL